MTELTMLLKKCFTFVVIVQVLLVTALTVAPSVAAESDDLMDFDFDSEVKSELNDTKPTKNQVGFDNAFEEFFDIMDPQAEEMGSHLQQKEKRIKLKMLTAWKNPNMQRKFAEVLPILKVMTSQQKIALAALVSAQVGSKQGRELNLDQVKVMFGDRKELILPLVLDIANLVRMAAESNDAAPRKSSRQTLSAAESLPSAEFLHAEPQSQRVLNLAMQDARLNVDIDDEPKTKEATEENAPAEQRSFLVTRSAPFYDHLLKMVPNYKGNQRKLTIQRRSDPGPPPSPPKPIPNIPLNQRPFLVPSTPAIKAPIEPMTTTAIPVEALIGNTSYNEVEDLALSALNGTYVADSQASETSSGGELDEDDDVGDQEALPTAEKLIGGRYRGKPHSRYPNRKPQRPSASLCEKFTGSVCLRVEDYPMDQIMGSIRRHKYAMGALLAEYRDKSDDVDHIDYSHDFNSAYHRRREDETGQPSPGAMCPSLIRYARPQKARSASGEWKYIVNTGQHTQTLRLEKCSKPQESCTYLTDNFRSRCIQVYNYHRLLSWDKTRGLHVDIFKVPTCCSCRIDGYKEVFPPLSSHSSHYTPAATYHHDDYRPAPSNIRNPYSTIHGDPEDDEDDDEDNEDEDEEDSVGYQYSNGFKRKKATKHSGIDSYLTPPTGKYDTIPFKRGPSTSSVTATASVPVKSKRPNRTNNRDLSVAGSRSDTIISPRLTTEPVRRTTLAATGNVESKAAVRHKSDKEAADLDLSSSRINYNYHPIIDFFEDGGSSESDERLPVKEARTGEPGAEWRPMVNGLKSL